MLDKYIRLKPKEKEKILDSLPKAEQKSFNEYMEYRKGRGLNSSSKISDNWAMLMQLRATAEKDLAKLDIKEVTRLASLVRESDYGQYTKNEILIALKRFTKWKNPKVNSTQLEDIRLIRKPVSKKIINNNDLFTKEDIEKLIKQEPKMFWKAFIITQFEAGLRTKETRLLTWDNVEFNSDGEITTINIFSTKTNKPRPVFVKEATYYLKTLRDQQENLDQKGKYIFHGIKDINQPVSRSLVSMWMRRLSQRVLGRRCWNYLLRHSRGNELYQLSKKGKISKDIALEFMGHSEKMSKVYTHDQSEEVKQMLKDQIYNLEDLPPEKKEELEKRIEAMEKYIHSLNVQKAKGKEANPEEYELVTEKMGTLGPVGFYKKKASK